MELGGRGTPVLAHRFGRVVTRVAPIVWNGPIGGCSLTLSGGTSGTYPCTLRAAVWSSLNDVGQILVGRTASAEAPAISATLSFVGEPLAGTYADDDATGDLALDGRF